MATLDPRASPIADEGLTNQVRRSTFQKLKEEGTHAE